MTANQNDAARMLRETIAGMMNVLDIARTDKDGDKFKFVFTRAGSMLRLQETIESAEKALAATANVQAEEVPATFIQERAQLDREWTALRELTRHCREAMKGVPAHPAQGDAELRSTIQPRAWLHDDPERCDVIHADVKALWLKAKPQHVEHYSIELYSKEDASAAANEFFGNYYKKKFDELMAAQAAPKEGKS